LRADTIPEDRLITDAEVAVVTWLLLNASTEGDLSHLLPSVPALRVVGRCPCGCPSVDFELEGQAAGASPVADAYGATDDGVGTGVILWGRDGRVTGIEFYELAEPVWSLPQAGTLSLCPPA
jgi:hypothetical protein